MVAPIDMDVVRDLHAKGWRLKAIAAALGVRYNRLAEKTAAAGIRFRNCPHKRLRPKAPPTPPKRNRKAEPIDVMHAESDRTRRFLDLWAKWENELRRDLKDKLWQQVQALRA